MKKLNGVVFDGKFYEAEKGGGIAINAIQSGEKTIPVDVMEILSNRTTFKE